jgi:hypothetical protein
MQEKERPTQLFPNAVIENPGKGKEVDPRLKRAWMTV